jgi:amidase
MIERDDELGAFCRHGAVRVEGAANGPLSGRRFAAKDVLDVEGHRCCAGNPDWLASHEPAGATAAAVRRVLDAGATLTAKALCDELTYSITGRNDHYGVPVNPRAPGRLPGGSSSGSAAAVAGGLVDLALGTDTTGSIRTPAALCGIWGLRPTHGSVPAAGAVPLAPSFDTVGARTADPLLLRAVYEVLLDGPRSAPAWARVLLPEDAWAIVDPAVRTVLEPLAGSLGRELPSVRVVVAEDGLDRWAEAVRIAQAHEIWEVHGEWVQRVRPRFGPGVEQRMQAARRIGAGEARRARDSRDSYGRLVRDVVGDDGVLVLPTCPTVPPPGDASEDELTDWRSRVMRLTSLANVSGLPQLALPGGELDGLPVSLSLIGPAGSELALIDLACRLDR